MRPHKWVQEESCTWSCKNCGKGFVTLASPFVRDGVLCVYSIGAFSARVIETDTPINCNVSLVERLMEK